MRGNYFINIIFFIIFFLLRTYKLKIVFFRFSTHILEQKTAVSDTIVNEDNTCAASLVESDSALSYRSADVRIMQNFLVVWIDPNIDEVNDNDCRNISIQLQQVINTVKLFNDIDEAIDFVTDIDDEKIFIIFSDTIDRATVYLVEDIPQINTIYILCENKAQHIQWTQQISKVEGVYTNILPICKSLENAVRECDHNNISMSFIATNKDLDQLDQSFMYTQILKEILLTIEFNQEHFQDFILYCRELFASNSKELKNVDKLEQEYYQHTSIWWYTYPCFLYSMLNKALRTMEVDIIIKLGFFLCDLHKHLVQLHSEQYNEDNYSDSFIVYRGQGMSQTDFDELIKTEGGLLSFNNFLSTSKNSQVSVDFARRATLSSNQIGVFFVITMDPSISYTPFANIRHISYYQQEDEILFSMHSIFRIEQIKGIDEDKDLWQVNLTLTNDNDPQLNALTECMREETFPNAKGWHRLACLLIKLGEFDKAKQVYDVLLNQISNDGEKAYIYHMIGTIKTDQGEYEEAIKFYEKSISIQQEILPSDHIDFATAYNNIAGLYDKRGEYLKALSYYEKALPIYQEHFSSNHRHLATLYNNIGLLYNKMGQYSKALSYHKNASEIYQKNVASKSSTFSYFL